MAKNGKMNASQRSAQELANLGRYGDSMLVHMNPMEVNAMDRMGPGLTRHPQTGLPEAFLPFLAPLFAAGAAAAPAAAAALPAAAAAIPAAAGGAAAALPAAAAALPAAASAAAPAAASALPAAASALPATAGALSPAVAPTLSAATPAALAAPEVGAAALSPTLTSAAPSGLTGGALGTAEAAALPAAEAAVQPVTEAVKSQAVEALTQVSNPADRIAQGFSAFEPPLSPVDIPGSGLPMPAEVPVSPVDIPGSALPGAPPVEPPLSPVDIPGSGTLSEITGPVDMPMGGGLSPESVATPEPFTAAEPFGYQPTSPEVLPPADIAPPPPATAAPQAAAAEAAPAAAPAEGGGLFSKQNLIDYGIPIAGGLYAMGAFSGDEGGEEEEEEEAPELIDPSPGDYTPVFPGEGYQHGTDPEWVFYPNQRYFPTGGMVENGMQQTSPLMMQDMGERADGRSFDLANSGNMMEGIPEAQKSLTLNLQAGGPVDLPADPMMGAPMQPPQGMGQAPGIAAEMSGQAPDPNVVIDGAIAALQGQHPNPESAIQMFLMIFGPEALQQLQMDIQGQAGEVPRLIEGPGGPQDDMVPARINGTQEAGLSDGEFVMTADAVRNIGNGNRMAGAQELSRLNDMYSRQPNGALNINRVG